MTLTTFDTSTVSGSSSCFVYVLCFAKKHHHRDGVFFCFGSFGGSKRFLLHDISGAKSIA